MSAWTRLFVSHALATLLGVTAGNFYMTKVSTSTQDRLHALKRRPLLDAASTASRFGSPEHARATTDSLRRIPVSTSR